MVVFLPPGGFLDQEAVQARKPYGAAAAACSPSGQLRGSEASGPRAEGWPQRPLPLRQRAEIQEVLREVMSAIRIFNVEVGLPSLDEARRLVIGEIKQAKRAGARVLKVIHGYGSSGKGGALCVGLAEIVRAAQEGRRDQGRFVAGEDFSIFNETVLDLLEASAGVARRSRTWAQQTRA
jgi:hypothetical protein